jgi:hypothetical protein
MPERTLIDAGADHSYGGRDDRPGSERAVVHAWSRAIVGQAVAHFEVVSGAARRRGP